MKSQYILYGAPFSLYTAKIRAYLHYKKLPFEEVLSTVSVYRRIIVPNTGVRFVPVVQAPQGEYLQDTAHIIDTLELRHPDDSVLPESPRQKLVSRLFELLADEWLLLPAMHYRWNRPANFPFIYQQFGRVISPWIPKFLGAYLGKKIANKFRGFVPLLGISDGSIPAIEQWYEGDFLPQMDDHFSRHDFLLGGRPSLGDFCLMGPLGGHLLHDPAPRAMMLQRAPHLVAWGERMKCSTDYGTLLPDDEVPTSLNGVLARIFQELWPLLKDTVAATEAFYDGGGRSLPRRLGVHIFRMGGVSAERAILPFQQWKFQRVLDCYMGLSATERRRADDFLADVGGADAMTFPISRRVERKNNRLVFAVDDSRSA